MVKKIFIIIIFLSNQLFAIPSILNQLKKTNNSYHSYISEKETADIVDFWKGQGDSTYDEGVIQEIEKETSGSDNDTEKDFDERYDEAVVIVTEAGQASISMVQRRLRVGYNRAARMIETMEKEGIVGPADGAKPRQVLVRSEYS